MFLLTILSSITTGFLLSGCSWLFSYERQFLKLAMPFIGDNLRTKTGITLANKYNSWIENNNKKQEGYLPIKVYPTGSYPNNFAQLSNQSITRDYGSLPNLSIGYADSVYDLSQNGNYVLDFSKSTKQAYQNHPNPRLKAQANSYSNDQIDQQIFADSFLQQNKNIDLTDPNGLYLVPTGNSLSVLLVNKIVFNYLTNQLLENDLISIKNTDQSFFQQRFGVGNNQAKQGQKYTPPVERKNSVEKNFHDLVKNPKTKKLEISKTIFENYEDFFNFCNLVSQSFPNKLPGSILEFEPGNFYQFLPFLVGNANYDHFLWNKRFQEETFNYSFLGEDHKDSQSGDDLAQNLKTIYNQFLKLDESNGIWKPLGPNAYSSYEFNTNKLLFANISNSGYDYYHVTKRDNQIGPKEDDLYLTLSPYYYQKQSQAAGFISQGGSFFGISFNNPKLDHATRLFMKWMIDDQQKIKYIPKNSQEEYEVNPMTYYALTNGYFPGLNSFINQNNKNKLMKAKNHSFNYEVFEKLGKAGNKNSAQNQKQDEFSWGLKVPQLSQTLAYIQPAGELSPNFRSLSNSNGTLPKLPPFDQFWNNLKTNYRIQYWVNKNKQLIIDTKKKLKATKVQMKP